MTPNLPVINMIVTGIIGATLSGLIAWAYIGRLRRRHAEEVDGLTAAWKVLIDQAKREKLAAVSRAALETANARQAEKYADRLDERLQDLTDAARGWGYREPRPVVTPIDQAPTRVIPRHGADADATQRIRRHP